MEKYCLKHNRWNCPLCKEYRAGVEAMRDAAIEELQKMYPSMVPSVINRYRDRATQLLFEDDHGVANPARYDNRKIRIAKAMNEYVQHKEGE